MTYICPKQTTKEGKPGDIIEYSYTDIKKNTKTVFFTKTLCQIHKDTCESSNEGNGCMYKSTCGVYKQMVMDCANVY